LGRTRGISLKKVDLWIHAVLKELPSGFGTKSLGVALLKHGQAALGSETDSA